MYIYSSRRFSMQIVQHENHGVERKQWKVNGRKNTVCSSAYARMLFDTQPLSQRHSSSIHVFSVSLIKPVVQTQAECSIRWLYPWNLTKGSSQQDSWIIYGSPSPLEARDKWISTLFRDRSKDPGWLLNPSSKTSICVLFMPTPLGLKSQLNQLL